MLDGAEYSSPSEYYPDMNMSSLTASKKKKSKNKIRFSDDQIRSLEVMFESETKLEPRKKVQLAKELGLQPRQVAIWFQNKRARWKSKQIEKDYSLLLADYNNLSSQFESLKKENQALLSQLQKLKNEMVEKPENSNQFQSQETAAAAAATGNISSTTSDEESDYKRLEFDVMNVGSKSFEGILSDEDNNSSSIKTEFLGLDDQDQNDLLQMVEPAPDSSLTSAEEWGSLDSDDLIHQPAQSCQWWDFWS